MKIFDDAFQRKLIYIFEIDDAAHKGLLKIGETTIKNLPPNEKNLKFAAQKRIRQYTNTAAIPFEVLHAELAVTDDGKIFRDYDVHRVLKKFRVKLKGSTGREWFKVDLDTARRAIAAVKQGKNFFAGASKKFSKIIFRPEQLDAINRTVEHFRRGGKYFLWNAKMRFGKTLCALEVARQMKFSKTIIITHRPVVDAGWYDDFKKIFGGTNYIYLNDELDAEKNFVYFVSIQDLRGSEVVGGKFDKNEKIFETDWDFVIVDEAHEGTTTELGDAVIKNIVKENSKTLALSGTPFNIIEYYGENVFTWDYVMEQRAKKFWDENNFGDPNPYADLPAMKIFTYDLGKLFDYVEDDAFSFREFFVTDGKNFVHEADVKNFLDLLTSAENYPFAREDFRKIFKHTLWIIPGVKEGKALSELLRRHEIFCNFKIVNVAGNGDTDDEPADALEKVRDAIKANDFTITLSCGKLTAGVTVPEWSAVFMLAGGSSTSAANYLQTIFRVQSPCTLGGRVKENCFVFDFAPDRTLKMLAQSAAISPQAGKTKEGDRQILNDLLNFCPVISLSGSRMEFRADDLLRQLKSAWIERAVRRGFDDSGLYTDELLNLDELALENLANIQKIMGTSKTSKSGDIVVNDQGLSGERRKKNPRQPRTPEQKELDRRKRERLNAIKILRGISIRMPLLIYGADVPFDADIKIEDFADLIDDESWKEFMPNGITKEIFATLIKYYDRDIFIAAGRKIRALAKDADDLKPADRVQKIAELFATFRNPDKETVLTPWRVVQLHIDSAFDENFFSPDKKILEINSKTGLYPLCVVQKIFRARLGGFVEDDFTPEALNRFWDAIVAENIFVICKTPMAEKITRRTLVGFRGSLVNARCFDDLINLLKTKPADFLAQVKDKNFWSKGVGEMFFHAVVGNPPYQTAAQGDKVNYSSPVYHLFLDAAFKLADKVSLITPARFLSNAGDTPNEFNQKVLNDPHFKVVRYEPDSTKFFPSSDIKGGVVITLRDATKTFEPIKTFTEYEEMNPILKKVDNEKFQSFKEIVYTPVVYKLSEKFFSERPELICKLQKPNDTVLRTNIFERLPEIFFDAKPNDGRDYIQILGRANGRRVYKWIRRDYITSPEPLDKFKILLPYSNGTGAFGEELSTPIIGSPLVGSTQTFITVGAFDTRAEAENCMVYIKSKFARAMLGILKVTQHNPPSTWAKVPLQDFSSTSDIDWRGNVDAQLYAKYKLNDAEKNFIEERVREMP